MELTPAQVKNFMRRGLRRLVDPEPDAIAKINVWNYFERKCAYCGIDLDAKSGDIDHLVPASVGGSNALANRVLSCKPCNAQEKRDQPWEQFLGVKCPDQSVLNQRREHIEMWVKANGGHPVLDPDMFALLDKECERVTSEYDVACQRIRARKAQS